MLSQKELGALGTVYFANLPLASHYGFDSFDLLVQMIELMKRIGEIQNELANYNTKVLNFETPEAYQQAFCFLDECKKYYPKQVGMFIKTNEDSVEIENYKDALEYCDKKNTTRLYKFIMEWAKDYCKDNGWMLLEDVLDWIRNTYKAVYPYSINEYLLVTDIDVLIEAIEDLGLDE